MIERIGMPLVAAIACAGLALVAGIGTGRAEEGGKAGSALAFSAKDIDGKPVELAEAHRGQVVLIVNTASKCGYTKQYKGLEALHEKYKDKGFAVLAFPANEFGGQEPGTNSQIKEFCSSTYNVTFPLYEKVVVKGDGIHPMFAYLTGKETDPEFGGPIKWNFTKFLVDRKGKVVARFEPGDEPGSEKVAKAVEAALAASK